MAHWAKIEDNKVVNVLVTDNNDPNGDEGYQWLLDTFGGEWVKTSYNHRVRGKFAGIGDTYDALLDRFIPKQTYPSWTLDADFVWQPPIEYPNDGKPYTWNEDTQSWDEVVIEN